MTKFKHVSMLYRTGTNLKAILELGIRLERSRESIISTNNLDVLCKVAFNTSIIANAVNGFKVYIRENKPDHLESALQSYILFAGLPNFVEVGSDYNLIEKVLEGYGKTLEKRLSGLLGKNVVNIEASVI